MNRLNNNLIIPQRHLLYSSVIRLLIVISFIFSFAYAGVTGKISGRVYNLDTGDPLIGVNLQVVDTYHGAATDVDGHFNILNVPPGTYSLKVSMIGFTDKVLANIRVEIDLTTRIEVGLKPEVIEGEAVVVEAEQKVIKMDVAASQTSISSDEINELPVSSVSEVIGMRAGISGFSVRGGGTEETLFIVDGITMKDERTNKPITGIPLSAVQDLSVQTGGFSAEYHNMRSGVVNVVTKEGNRSRYSGTFSLRQSPPGQKHFGKSPYDKTSYWNRPYFDDDVAWTGTTNGAWDEYTQRQYPTFNGWNDVSEKTLIDADATNDLTPASAKKLFTWEHRKNGAISDPDYNIDAGFGGPVPFVSTKLGDLRFFASYRQEQDMYLYAVSEPGLSQKTGMVKFTSDINKSTKFAFTFINGDMSATSLSRGGNANYMDSVWDLASQVNRRGFTMPWRIFTNEYWSKASVNYSTLSGKLTKVFSPTSFLEVLVKHDTKHFTTGPSARRDTSKIFEVFDNWYADEAPNGFKGSPEFSVEGRLAFGGAISTSRDSTELKTISIKADYINQINMRHQIKTGFELLSNQLKMEFGSVNEFLPEGNYWTSTSQYPLRASFYIQDKLEFEGFIATAGLNLDYINPNGDWYAVEIYDDNFFSSSFDPENETDFPMEKISAQTLVSPRLAISHPITEVSKLYFNYGHYLQLPVAQDLYRIRRGNSNEVMNMGDPSLPLARTISYELGYDHALADIYLLHLSAYYKDIADQQDYTNYISANSKVIYSQLTANSYEDIRGFEIELSKMRGDWITGNINFEYRVNTSGYFGVGKYYENPSEQREFLSKNDKQYKPRPIPRIKGVLDFHTPLDFGPSIFNQKILGDWHMNMVFNATAGSWFTYNPNNVPGIEYNVQWKNSYNVDMKVSKTFSIGKAHIKFFADIYNVFNVKTFSGYGFTDGYDWNYYMQSLHLPESVAGELGYKYFEGEDKPGDYRLSDIDFVPMEWVSNVQNISSPSERPIYYDSATDTFHQWTQENGWGSVDQSYYQYVIDNKAYIDMPNQSSFIFLNPRDFFAGISISYDF